ncbi:MAG: hypothetical protein ACI9N1_001176 [Flavobacteriales bacterium]|jgi:hypothetical protein
MRILLFSLFVICIGCNSNDTNSESKSDQPEPVLVSSESELVDVQLIAEDEIIVVENLGANELDAMTGDVKIIESIDSVKVQNEAAVNEYDDIDWQDYEASMTKDYSYVILISTKSYGAALERAIEAAEKLGYPLNLRDLSPNDEIGLTLPVDLCEGICGDIGIQFPQYLPRNNYGDTKYISVEYSDGFEGFTKGYYIVVAASGEKGSTEVKKALQESKTHYKDAYSKTCGVWMGCGC